MAAAARRRIRIFEGEERLNRVQRALAFKQYQGQGKRCNIDGPFDHRKSSAFDFEKNALFLAFHIELEKDCNGKIIGVVLGVARMHHSWLERMGPGRNGENFMSVVRSCHLARSIETELDELALARTRRLIALCFESVHLDKGLGGAIDAVLPDPINVLLVAHNRAELLQTLDEVGFDPKEHPGVLDIVDITELAEAFRRRQREEFAKTGAAPWEDSPRSHISRLSYSDVLEELEIQIPDRGEAGKGPFACAMASSTLQAMVKYAVLDMEKHVGKLMLREGNGGNFPGPYLKAECPQETLEHRVKRILSLRRTFTARQIQDHTLKLFNSRRMAIDHGPMNDTITDRRHSKHRQEKHADPIRMAGRLSLRFQPTDLQRRTGPVHVFGRSGPVSNDEIADSIIVSTFACCILPNAVSKLSQAAVLKAILAYHQASETFTRLLLAALKAHFQTGGYVERGTTGSVIISPREGYLTLARKLCETAPRSITPAMMEALFREIVGRHLVDDYKIGSSESGSHRSLTRILKTTFGILAEIIIFRVPDFDTRFIGVARAVREAAG